MFWKILLLLLLAIAAWYLYQKFVAGKADAVDSAATTATQAVAGAGGDIAGQVSGFFSSATETLGGITDVDSAKAALPALTEAGASLDGLGSLIGGAGDDAKEAIAGAGKEGLGALTEVTDKLMGDDGIKGVLEPVVGPMMEKLTSMFGG